MQQICLVIPVKPGMGDDARAFMRELESSRRDAYAASERRIGITRETWHLAVQPTGELLIAQIETESFAAALGSFSASRDDFDMWFKRRLAESTGLDLNDPPDVALPELVSSYTA